MIDTTQLQNDILNGTYDNILRNLNAVVSTRLHVLNRPSQTGMVVGAKVRFNDKVRQQYLIGQTATIVKVNRVKVKIKLDRTFNRFAGLVNCPTNLLDLI